jgi:predicted DNA-binding transcriptional regulator YafY
MSTLEHATAGDQLSRLLHIIPAAARDDGCDLAELARVLETSTRQLLRDLEEVTTRAFYHPAGSAENLQVLVEGDRVQIFTTGQFRRPLKLSPLEGLALALGFRVAASREDSGARSMLLEAAVRIETQLATKTASTLVERFAVEDVEQGHAEVHEVIHRAAGDRRCLRIEYIRPGRGGVEERTIHPYALVKGAAGWYVLAHCSIRSAVRAFRLDRVMSARALDETFEIPESFDPREWITPEGRVYRAPAATEVAVRYAASIARHIRERGPVEEQPDGSVIVRLQVADTDWVIRHVLRHGAEAEILEPADCRARIAELLASVAG